MTTPDYSIQAISELTGVLPVTLRAWERRYGLIRPARTARGHRRYGEADLRRIRRILAWLERGLPIGQVRAVLDGEDAPVLAGDPWRRAAEDGLAALAARNVPRMEQWFQRLVADYALEKVLTQCCDPLREHLRARPDGAAARLLLDSFLRQKLGGRALALAPGRRDPAWLVLAVGDPLPALSRAVPRGAPVWCLEDAPPWSALAPWLADPRTRGVLWVLGEHPGRRRADQLWPADAAPDLPAWCTGPALTDELITPPWLRRVPGDRAALYAAWDAALHDADNEHADKEETPVRLVWFRNDLRCHGHTPLTQALAGGDPVIALYLLCPRQWDDHEVAPLRRWYVLESLLELGDTLAAKGIDLHVLDAGDFDGAVDTLADFVAEQGVREIFCNREYPLNELNRDRAVARRLEQDGVRLHGFDDGVLVPPRTLSTGKGTPYTVFTAYKKRWDQWLDDADPGALPAPAWPASSGASKKGRFHGRDRVAALRDGLDLPDTLTAPWQPGETAAYRQLYDFVEHQLGDYKRYRDFPAEPGTSGLSTALSAGTLAPLDAYLAARRALADSGAREGAATWIGELAWRDFYRQIMHRFPQLATGAPFRPETRLLQWHDNDAHFQAWCEGRTGYPLVDAAMRQLVRTGWMHNRLRMLTAMFLSKHLFIDWHRGERFFMQHLIDGDFASNNGGWQWSASTGTDAAPYFRVFSPIRQSHRFDPQGRFIARYVPELAELDDESIHEPWKQPLLCPDYPAPIVAHKGVKEFVQQAFRQAGDAWRQQENGQ